MYFVRIPYIIKKLFSEIIWELPNNENKIFLTFDDGPHPEITPWILEKLRKHDAKATFFCSGKNVEQYPGIIAQILKDGHTIGNHGYAHLNGWKTKDDVYLEDFKKANDLLVKNTNNSKSEKILKQVQDDIMQQVQDESMQKTQDDNMQKIQNDKLLFRPAYGKIKKSQLFKLKSQVKIVKWSLMPGDFDSSFSSEKCLENLTRNIKTGDIIVLHDNEKSWKHLEYCLPKWLAFIDNKGLKSETISLQ
jgi:peptidoglycan/xylan/chitin deacetylase (PgdA/CDA1 family)